MAKTIAEEAIGSEQAGPVLDALMAEHVLGWKPWKRSPDGEMVWDTGDDSEDGSPTFKGFEPSARIEHAWKIVEKLTAMPTPWLVGIHNIVSAAGVRWAVSIDGCAVADTLPLAICRAALLLPAEKPRSQETFAAESR